VFFYRDKVATAIYEPLKEIISLYLSPSRKRMLHSAHRTGYRAFKRHVFKKQNNKKLLRTSLIRWL
jgi:hypothetical protein